MKRAARLLFPALRWDPARGFDGERELIELSIRLGVGGYSIFSGDADAVRALTAELRERSPFPLLIASDLERGAGQQFPQCTALPPLAAIGALDDVEVTRRAGALTARESLAVGVNWLYAPVADVDLEPKNPIVGSRAFGDDAAHVARHVVAWMEGAHAQGALCCAKHFPGHGRTVDDSHAALPRVDVSRQEMEVDLVPFRAAIDCGVDSVMTAHVVYDAFDASTAATLSAPILQTLLRHELNFHGLVVSDALIMEGMLQAGQGSEAAASVAALRAGCDALLYPGDLEDVVDAVEAAIGDDVSEARFDEAIQRIDSAARRARSHSDEPWGQVSDREWADAIALRTCTVVRGAPAARGEFDLLTIDDDLGGPFAAPARDVFEQTLRECGMQPRSVAEAGDGAALVIAVYADIRAWKGMPGLTARAEEELRAALAVRPDATIVFFGHPRLCAPIPGEHMLAAWGGEAVMQRAAARRLAGR